MEDAGLKVGLKKSQQFAIACVNKIEMNIEHTAEWRNNPKEHCQSRTLCDSDSEKMKNGTFKIYTKMNLERKLLVSIATVVVPFTLGRGNGWSKTDPQKQSPGN